MAAPPTIPDVQKAWVSVRKGKPKDSLEFKTDWPVKKPLAPGEVLIKVHAAALNPVGYKLMKLLPNFIARRPYVPEADFSGTVVDSNDSKEFKVGDEVFGWILFNTQRVTKQGALAEYIAVPDSFIVKRPSNISEIEAAGVTLTAMTALQALNQAGLEEGQTLFVNGGSTAVGAYAIQFAKIRGAKVVATASGKNEEYVRKMGADEFIDYTKVGALHTHLKENPPHARYNVILEAVGQFDPSLYTHSQKYLAPNGIFISVGPQPNKYNLTALSQFLRLAGAKIFPSLLTGIKPSYKIVIADPKKVEDLKFVQKCLEEGEEHMCTISSHPAGVTQRMAGKIKPSVDSVHSFEDVFPAYEKIMSLRARASLGHDRGGNVLRLTRPRLIAITSNKYCEPDIPHAALHLQFTSLTTWWGSDIKAVSTRASLPNVPSQVSLMSSSPTELSIPATQNAWVSVRKGVPSRSLEFNTDWPVRRTLAPGEVLVKVHAAALNPLGYKLMTMVPGFVSKRPYVPEHDFSGTIVDSNGSEEFKVGDEVFGWVLPMAQRATKQGTLSEYLTVSESCIAKRPSNISEIEAAGVTAVAITALQALDLAKLEEGQTLFVNGGSTGVGAYAIQMAKMRGARVVAVASGGKEEYVRKMGADEFIDYTKVGPLHKYLHDNPPSTKYNVILEAVGWFDPSLYTYSSRYLAPNGVFVSVGPTPDGFGLNTISQLLRFVGAIAFPSFVTGIKPQYKILRADESKEDIRKVAQYLEEGKIKPSVDSVYGFQDVLKAYERLMSSRAAGKVTINVSLPPTD
ncbi:hypothetical protein NMY22_g8500 [Coprinellus aureogranulatus]|nr:hypothetical protein NMY22_g8500 [Coprinellus aureogranulatus]